MKTRYVLLILTVLALFALITVGAFVTADNAGDACGSQIGTDYPLCQGQFFPPLQVAAIAEWSHRVLASLSALLLFLTTFLYWRAKDSPRSARRSLYVASAIIVFEIALGAAVVASEESLAWLVTLHQANAMLVFGLASMASAFAYKS